MNIAFLTNNINQIGGIERVINILANYFYENFEYNIEIISLYSEDYNSVFKFNSKIKVKHCSLNNIKINNIKDRIKNRQKMIKEVKEILKDEEYDVIMTFHAYISDYVLANKNSIKGKILVTEHCNHNYEGKVRRYINRQIYKRSDKLIVLKESDKLYYKKYIKQVTNIPNAVSFKSNLSSSCENKRIIAIGRLEDVKGFDYLIDSFNLIHEKYPKWKLDILGDGSYRNILNKKIKQYGLNDKVRLLHSTDNVKKELLDSSIYACTSKSEGFCLTLVEAMECGLPVVSFDIDSAKEILSEEDSLLVKSYSIHDFAKSLSILIEDDKKRKEYGKQSKVNARKYHIENISEQWKYLIENI